jgi:hypothetical protein
MTTAISGVYVINPLVASFDIHGRKSPLFRATRLFYPGHRTTLYGQQHVTLYTCSSILELMPQK